LWTKKTKIDRIKSQKRIHGNLTTTQEMIKRMVVVGTGLEIKATIMTIILKRKGLLMDLNLISMGKTD
jgi:hypothetical protein